MILKCSHCQGLMKVDDDRLPQGKRAKVRCPHCDAVGLMGEQLTPLDVPSDSVSPPAEDSTPKPEQAPSKRRPFAERFKDDPDYHFPAEETDPKKDAKPRSKTRQMIFWAALSVFVALFFALVVNLILPGPPR